MLGYLSVKKKIGLLWGSVTWLAPYFFVCMTCVTGVRKLLSGFEAATVLYFKIPAMITRVQTKCHSITIYICLWPNCMKSAQSLTSALCQECRRRSEARFRSSLSTSSWRFWNVTLSSITTKATMMWLSLCCWWLGRGWPSPCWKRCPIIISGCAHVCFSAGNGKNHHIWMYLFVIVFHRDFMDPTMDSTKHILNYLMPILEQVDAELYDFMIR